eukprot:8880526-Prorocentrum_lima.AAC.1
MARDLPCGHPRDLVEADREAHLASGPREIPARPDLLAHHATDIGASQQPTPRAPSQRATPFCPVPTQPYPPYLHSPHDQPWAQ